MYLSEWQIGIAVGAISDMHQAQVVHTNMAPS